MKRIFDLILVIILLILLSIPMLFIALLVKLTSKGPILFWSDRIGINNRTFKMPKFRTMRLDAPAVATHLLDNPKEFLIHYGSFLRRFSLDELPQLWSVLKGDMSFIGPSGLV
jgi:O-antigen biosynthesis protein WbqP